MKYASLFISLGGCLLCLTAASKYSAKLNEPHDPKGILTSNDPFRMQKINLLWEKAKKRLPDSKLQILYTDLKQQDKDEILLKKLKAEGQDRDGIKEAALRKKLKNIMLKYSLNDPWNEVEDNQTSRGKEKYHPDAVTNKFMFKDKKLNKLWKKAEKTGLSADELNTLKEEFLHHQEKVEQYYQLMDNMNDPDSFKEGQFMSNDIEAMVQEAQKPAFEKEKSRNQPSNQILKEKHRDINNHFDILAKKVYSGKDSDQEFEEHAVQRLWELAVKSNFTPAELKSLKEELLHYEHRMKKLRHFQAELDMEENKLATNQYPRMEHGGDHQKHLKRKVKDIEYKVSKLHGELEGRIMARHSEL